MVSNFKNLLKLKQIANLIHFKGAVIDKVFRVLCAADGYIGMAAGVDGWNV